jgi:hypothetical protein
MMAMVEEKGSANGQEDYTQDGTVDLKGRPILRSKTGRWKACSFIVGKMKPFAAFIFRNFFSYSSFGFSNIFCGLISLH